MDYTVIGKFADKNTKGYAKLSLERPLFERVEIDNRELVDFEPEYGLFSKEWYCIKSASKAPYFPKFPFDLNSVAQMPNMSEQQFSCLSWCAALQDNGIYFQRVIPSLFERKKVIYIANGDAETVLQARLLIHERPDAVYYQEKDILIFKNISALSPIFEGIDEIRGEVPAYCLEAFGESNLFHFENGFSPHNASPLNKTRMSLVLDEIIRLNRYELGYLLWKLNERLSNLRTNKTNTSICISDDAELKSVIDVLEEWIYRPDDYPDIDREPLELSANFRFRW